MRTAASVLPKNLNEQKKFQRNNEGRDSRKFFKIKMTYRDGNGLIAARVNVVKRLQCRQNR